MKLLVRSALLAGVAVLAVVGTALADNLGKKVMTVNLPDGLTARVEYQGDVAPTVSVEPYRPDLAAWSRSTWAPGIMSDPILDIDRQFDAIIRQVRMLDAWPSDAKALVNGVSPKSCRPVRRGTAMLQLRAARASARAA